ncbi:hypothetical protein, partial [uncultured Nostoc sp.]|uniref:hypothetical protein n=1 Tax=uncultured Nostoc sp. TaxID=340711 RepID=UPI0035C9C3EE
MVSLIAVGIFFLRFKFQNAITPIGLSAIAFFVSKLPIRAYPLEALFVTSWDKFRLFPVHRVAIALFTSSSLTSMY